MATDDELKLAETENNDGGRAPTESEWRAIAQDYEATLEIPAIKRTPQLLVCPVGLIGVGKTTVMKALQARLGFVRVRTDDIRQRLRDVGFDYSALKLIAVSLVEKYLSLGYSVGIDADCAGSTKPLIQSVAKKYPLRVIWLHVTAPEELIIERLKQREGIYQADDALADYYRRKPLHEHLDMPFLYTFDASRADLETQIDEAVEKIKATS